MYDAIVIGSRCAGAPTAMLLARHGRRVLVVDRATFPSDVLSGHTIQPAGMARLARWGLLERVRATGVPFASRVRFDFGAVVLDGSPLPIDGIDTGVCIRRTIIDPLLADAAEHAGAEVRFGVSVTELIWEDGRVAGIRGHDGTGAPIEARARVVVGADGANSFVARHVGAERRLVHPATTVVAYSYWRGVDLDHMELYARPGRFFIAAPTNDGLTFVAQQVPTGEAGRYRDRMDEAVAETLAEVPRLAAMVAAGERAERFRFSRHHDSFLRRSHGPGWALVGDAGYHKDPITAQGMLDAFRDAECLAGAIHGSLDAGPAALDAALAGYEEARDAAVMSMYELTAGLADLEAPPSPDMLSLLAALEGRPAHIARFLGVIAGSVSVPEFFAPESMAEIAAAA
ncbi:MAG TPA: NAD(P)/FAD-dependent oxidoreductase [Acidimicrobiales bacterium]|nr:NAD(P)/FAD-dependent oxidoreductase [Acidimicrobiales bacterium]